MDTTKQRLFFQVAYPLNSQSAEGLWICFQEDLNTKMDRPKLIDSVFGAVGMIEVEKDEVEHFITEVQDYTDILIFEKYSELMAENEECKSDKFWEDLV